MKLVDQEYGSMFRVGNATSKYPHFTPYFDKRSKMRTHKVPKDIFGSFCKVVRVMKKNALFL